VQEQTPETTFTDGGAVLSIACAVVGGVCCLVAVYFFLVAYAPGALFRFSLGDATVPAAVVGYVVPLAAMPVLGTAGCVLGTLSLRRIRSCGTALRGRWLAVLGIGAGVALVVLFGLFVPVAISAVLDDHVGQSACNP
jgi:hypothetical protein